jgi:predicted TIM-barrel fold metal-dependent hydrolase
MDKVAVISVDGHVKAPWRAYRDYLDPQWRAAYDERMGGLESRPDFVHPTLGPEAQWEPRRRVTALEEQGVVAEIVFPNGVPFEHEADPAAIRAGKTAYNRWLAEVAREVPGRLLPQALVDFDDIAGAVTEVYAARRNGFVGVLLPALRPGSHYFFDPALDPIWAACVETGLPIVQHGGTGAPRYEPQGPAAFLVLATEHSFFSGRSLWQLILGGTFDRFPNLKAVYVETETWWLRPVLETMDRRDRYGDDWAKAANAAGRGGSRPYKRLPSDYLRTNVFIGVSPFVKSLVQGEFDDGKDRQIVSTNNAMVGVDYPHPETALFGLREALNALLNLPNVSEEGARKVIYGNAAAAFGIDLSVLQPHIDRVGFELVRGSP